MVHFSLEFLECLLSCSRMKSVYRLSESLLHSVRCMFRWWRMLYLCRSFCPHLFCIYFSFSLPKSLFSYIFALRMVIIELSLLCKCKHFVQSASWLPLSRLVSSTVLCAVLAAFCTYGLSPVWQFLLFLSTIYLFNLMPGVYRYHLIQYSCVLMG